MNHSGPGDQGKDRPKQTAPTKSGKHHYVDPPSPGVKKAHAVFESQQSKEHEALDVSESLDIPLESLRAFVEKYRGAPAPKPGSGVQPGIDHPPMTPSMPDPDRVSQLPETEKEKKYMVQQAHPSAGPHVVIDTPFPEEHPSVDSLACSSPRPITSRTDMERLVPSTPAEKREDERTLDQNRSAGHVAASAIVEVKGLKKSYHKASIEIPVLRGVDFSIRCGQFVSIVGQSGSGKSTLLHLLGTLDAPDAGRIYFHGHRIDNLSCRVRDRFRNDRVGMIFQSYHLLPELNVLENVLSPLMIRESLPGYLLHRRAHRRRAVEILEAVGLGHRLKHRPRELSGGEMQRTAIARALVAGPELLLADEPTGNLDHQTGNEIMELLGRLNCEQNLTIVMVTHDRGLAEVADQTIHLVDGRVA